MSNRLHPPPPPLPPPVVMLMLSPWVRLFFLKCSESLRPTGQIWPPPPRPPERAAPFEKKKQGEREREREREWAKGAREDVIELFFFFRVGRIPVDPPPGIPGVSKTWLRTRRLPQRGWGWGGGEGSL